MANIRLNLTLIKYINKEEFTVTIGETVCLSDVLDEAGIPLSEVCMVIKNGRWASLDCKVTDYDMVELFPFLSGG
jgi:sulfur carrier protein ThiS